MSSTLVALPHTGTDECRRLVEGNRRWATGRSAVRPSREARRRRALVEVQSPHAVVVGCSDSRVPAELIFDQGVGDLFVVRTAGHVVDVGVLGSVEYAVEVLGVRLVVVLGHERCGAVAAATAVVDGGGVPDGHLGDVVNRIVPGLTAARAPGGQHVRQHALATAAGLLTRSAPLTVAVGTGRATVVAGVYSLSTGEVQLEPLGAVAALPAPRSGRHDRI